MVKFLIFFLLTNSFKFFIFNKFFIGTSKSQIYRIQLAEWKQELLNTCHNTVINDVAFPL